ncbi:MAG: hypothetical protein A2W36_00175 [Chloroflexi bacterium RBG_16_58_14]|nr:MAG: hypothetical protein A2W36_00175 [Chloroflexi bacterium RBG_16_58_14]
MTAAHDRVYDYVIIGSGFGGSVSAMRLTEKGYSVLVLERGKRYRDQDFATTNWKVWKYLWMPGFRCFGIMQISPFKDVVALHGSGVGGGSLGYANVLMQPDDRLFANPSWQHLQDWKATLLPYYATARRMLGVTSNPLQWPADGLLQEIAGELGTTATYRATDVGVFFGDSSSPPGTDVPDPYFDGQGPARTTCRHCGGCIVGCRYNAKNTLVKNYLYFAEQRGTQVLPEAQVHDIRPLEPGQSDGARYSVAYHRTTGFLFHPEKLVRARHVVVSAGSLGTQCLLFRCREVTRSLPRLSMRLGSMVRTNSETLLGATSPNFKVNYSEGLAITSIFQPDPVTAIEPVRYPKGSSLMRYLATPLIDSGGSFWRSLGRTLLTILRHPIQFIYAHIWPGWAERTTILLVMQTEDNRLRMRLGRGLLNLFGWGLVSMPDEQHAVPHKIDIGHQVTRDFARRIHGAPAGSIFEGIFNVPVTAHILGGVPFGLTDQEGVIDLDCQVHNYPGLYVVDGSIMPANPGINPSLTITALAEYAISRVPAKD